MRFVAVSLKDVEKAVCEFVESKPKIISLQPNTISDILDDILRVSSTLNITERGKNFIKKIEERMTMIKDKTRNLSKKTIACIEWIEPLMSAGNWIPELVEMAGGKNLFCIKGKHSPWLEWKDLVKEDPDIIVIMPCGFDIDKSKKEMSVLKKKKEWINLKAVKNQNVYVADGNQYFNRPGPRIVESLEILAEIFHPNLFKFGHFNRNWQKFI